ncbi:MAG: hypothetical protein AAGA30_12530, partial [Planctomycetota bacterium]
MARLQQVSEKNISKISVGIGNILRDEFDSSISINEHSTLDQIYLDLFGSKQCVDDLCPLEVLDEIARQFELRVNESRWLILFQLEGKNSIETIQNEDDLLRILSQWTVADLARYIGQRIEIPCFEPTVILGKRCGPAGAFFGIRKLLLGARITPSTPIKDKLNNQQIRHLWSQLEIWSDHKPKTLNTTNPFSLTSIANWVEAIGLVTTVFVTIWITFLSAQLGDSPKDSAFYCLLFFLLTSLVGYGTTKCFADQFHNPLPKGYTTFGDIAR